MPYQTIAAIMIGDREVTTVNLGTKYETMVFPVGSARCEYCAQYTNEKDALLGHTSLVQHLQTNMPYHE